MPAGKARRAKNDGYVFNRSAPAIATLPRATEELILAYRIFSPGLDNLNDLNQVAKNTSYGIENGMCGELIRNLGIHDYCELREVYKKSYAVYAAEIKRMEEEEEAAAAKLGEELAAREAREQAHEEREKAAEEQQKVAGQDDSHTHKKRRADEQSAPSSPIKRPRHDTADDMIPDPYWLSKEDAQAALAAMTVRAKSLEATLVRLQDFYLDTFIGAGVTPVSTIGEPLARADTQFRQDVIWYIDELQKIMGGAASTELGIAAGWEWNRARFHNAAVRGLIERIREFGARLEDTEKEMNEADRLRGEFVAACEKGGKIEGTRELFFEDWAKQLVRMTKTVAHEAREYVSFRTMEAEWDDKWAEKGEECEEEVFGGGSSPIVIDSSDSDEYDSLFDDKEDELEDDD